MMIGVEIWFLFTDQRHGLLTFDAQKALDWEWITLY